MEETDAQIVELVDDRRRERIRRTHLAPRRCHPPLSEPTGGTRRGRRPSW